MTKNISAYCPHNVFLMNILGPAPENPEALSAWMNEKCSYELVSELQKAKCPRCRQIAEKLEQSGMMVEEPISPPITGNLNLIGTNLNSINEPIE